MEYQSYKTILNSLRQHRKDLGLSQKKVAMILGLKDNTLISRWELGEALPNLVSAFRLSALYQVPIHELFGNLAMAVLAENAKPGSDSSSVLFPKKINIENSNK